MNLFYIIEFISMDYIHNNYKQESWIWICLDSTMVSKQKIAVLIMLGLASGVIVIIEGISVYRGVATALGQTQSINIDIAPGASVPSSGRFYDPPYKEISSGTNVSWTNRDTTFHTVTSGLPSSGPSLVFDSGILISGQKYSYIFHTLGIFRYYCTLHPFMTGTINVR